MSKGYPDYDDILDAKKRRHIQEMEQGRQVTIVHMAKGIIDRIDKELGIQSELIHIEPDCRKWQVRTIMPKGQVFMSGFWEFPTDELKATIMLLGGKVNGHT